MKSKLEQRLKELQQEFDAGQKMMADLEAKQANLRDTLLRLSGAIQVLQEELANESEPVDGASATSQNSRKKTAKT